MAEPKREAERLANEANAAASSMAERANEGAAAIAEAAARETEMASARARQGMRQATATAEAGVQTAAQSTTSVAEGVRDIAQSWARYAENVMRHSTEASQALLHCRSWSELLEIQAGLLRSNMQAFLEQSAKVTEIGSRMASRPFDAFSNQAGGKSQG